MENDQRNVSQSALANARKIELLEHELQNAVQSQTGKLPMGHAADEYRRARDQIAEALDGSDLGLVVTEGLSLAAIILDLADAKLALKNAIEERD